MICIPVTVLTQKNCQEQLFLCSRQLFLKSVLSSVNHHNGLILSQPEGNFPVFDRCFDACQLVFQNSAICSGNLQGNLLSFAIVKSYHADLARTIDRLAGALSRKLMLDSAEVARHLTDSAYCARWGYNTATIPALFIPNTYDIYWNVSLDKFMERMQKEHKTFWNFGRMEKAKSMGMSPVEVATMASIIDEETANNGEKPMIAGMYYNRLKTGMPLQADPTVKFALKDFALRRIYNKLLQTDSPYNTYKNTGLPPGPIKIASIAGIDAVLNHVRHDYLYMCAKEDFSGTHNFAKTYQEHLNNAARYTKALNQRGIK